MECFRNERRRNTPGTHGPYEILQADGQTDDAPLMFKNISLQRHNVSKDLETLSWQIHSMSNGPNSATFIKLCFGTLGLERWSFPCFDAHLHFTLCTSKAPVDILPEGRSGGVNNTDVPLTMGRSPPRFQSHGGHHFVILVAPKQSLCRSLESLLRHTY